jgi:DNA helicase IV
MAEVVAAAIRNRQRVPDSARQITVEGTRITLTPGMVTAARDRARASHKPHNRARLTFVTSLLDRLALALAEARGVDPDSNREILLADLRDSRDVRREVNLCWMPLTPEQVITDLWANPRVLAAAGPRLSPRERELLARSPGEPWTVSDVPLLDEAAELLGEDDEPARRAAAVAASERAQEEDYARGVLEMTGVTGLTAGALIDRYSGSRRVRRTVVDAALADRTWVYGHVVVDEAQELSPMQWRLLMRRCPSRSMTVVGDLAQAGSSAAPRTWADAFNRVAPGRWSVEQLTVNYRTPAPMMDLATRVLRAAGSTVTEPSSIRDGTPPRIIRVPDRDLGAAAGHEVVGWLGEDGRTAVIVPVSLRDPVARSVGDALPAGALGVGHSALDTRVSLLTVAEAKGLEFDQVVVVEPGEILAESARGGHDLYVALTRATQHLVVLHAQDLPPGFDSD